MASNSLEPFHESGKLTENNVEFSNKLQWAEFTLKERIVRRLLNLLSLATLFALAIIGFMIWRKMDVSSLAIGALIAGTVGCLGKLLHNVIKPYLGPRK